MGLVGAILTSLIGRYGIEPLACGSAQMLTACGDAYGIAGGLSVLIVAVAMLFVLIAFRQPRPFLVVIGASITLWSLGQYTTGLVWYEAFIWVMAVYCVVYALFLLIAKIRNIWVTTVFTVLVALSVRALTFF